ncbi:MAG: DnaJ domain-containing protein [Lachnospiraceae bacterium]|nr:DnaJ domain-containing protein [Lachnospiraceae bacterium]
MNYYEILEIKEDASIEVIKAAYKALVKKYHPDANSKSNQNMERNINSINEAYEVLSDENKRKEYDEKILRSKREENSNSFETDGNPVKRFWKFSDSLDDALLNCIIEVGEIIIDKIQK